MRQFSGGHAGPEGRCFKSSITRQMIIPNRMNSFILNTSELNKMDSGLGLNRTGSLVRTRGGRRWEE